MNLTALTGIAALLALTPPATPTTMSPVSSALPHGPILVVAPHPDDEVLIAAGIIARARRAGVDVDVAVMTNGGLGCGRDGGVRQAESVTGLAALGVTEDHIHFLGLPDGSLADLGTTPLPAIKQLDRDGRCVAVTTTSAWRGRGERDVHTRRTGRPGRLTVDVAEDDLIALLDELNPTLVVTTHELDTHPDHAATGILVRRALEVRATRDGTVPSPVHLWRGVVHVDDVWPKAEASQPPFTPDRPMPPLPSWFAGASPPLRIPVDDIVGGPTGKLAVLAAHRSQTGPVPEENWLAAFARTDEVVWPLVLAPAAPTQPAPRLVRPRQPGALPPIVVELTSASDVVALTVTLPSGPRRYRLWREGGRVVLEGGDRRRETRGVDVAGPGSLRVRAETFSGENVVEFSVWREGRLVALLVDPL